jgi:hypothetical protein
MSERPKARVLSIRTSEEVIAKIDDFRRAQIAIPTQTEALRALVRLGFEKWQERGGVPVSSSG